MRFLFSHNNYPAQFRRLIPVLVDAGHEVVFLCRSKEWRPYGEGVGLIKFEPHRSSGGAVIHPFEAFRRGRSSGAGCLQGASAIGANRLGADWIITHVGFGNGLYLIDVFPTARRIGLFEWYYNAVGSDADFAPEAGRT